MYFAELNDCIKYKTIRGPKKVLEGIVRNHNSRLKKHGTEIDKAIYKQDDMYCLLIEKTQEEIVQEIKEWFIANKQKIREKLNLSLAEINWLYISVMFCTYVVDFERFEKYFTIYDVYDNCFEKPKEYRPVIIEGKKLDLPDIDDIKRIAISDVLDKLGIEYKKTGYNTLALYNNGQWTDGWRADINRNIITDFSGKGRPQGNPYNFVLQYLNLSKLETFIWFKENLC